MNGSPASAAIAFIRFAGIIQIDAYIGSLPNVITTSTSITNSFGITVIRQLFTSLPQLSLGGELH